MATLPHSAITLVPQESTAPGAEYPALDPITVVDRVGPGPANRQPNSLEDRDNTMRERLNYCVENMNYVSTGGPGAGSLFLPRDGSEGMTGDLNISKVSGATKIDMTATSGSAWVYLRASSGNAVGVSGHVNSVQEGYVQISNNGAGAGGRVGVVVNDGTNPQHVVTMGTTTYTYNKTTAVWALGGSSYNFTQTAMTVPGAINVPTGSKLNLDGGTGNDYASFDGAGNMAVRASGTLWIQNASGLALSIAPTVMQFSGGAVLVSGSNALRFFGSNNYVYAADVNTIAVNAGANLFLSIATVNKFSCSSTLNTLLQDTRMSGTSQLQFNGINNYLYADGSDALYVIAGANLYLQRTGGSALSITATESVFSNAPVRMNGAYQLQFFNANNYVQGTDADSLVVNGAADITLAIGGTPKFTVASTYSESSQELRLVTTAAVKFGGSGGYTNSIYANGSNELQIVNTANTSIQMYVNSAYHFGVSSTLIDARTKRIANVVDPTGAQDAATMNYVDTQVSGVSGGWKLKVGSVGTESSLKAVTVGEDNCDFTNLEAAIAFVAATASPMYAIYVFELRTAGTHALTASRSLPAGSQLIGMSPKGGSGSGRVYIQVPGSATLSVSTGCVIRNIHFRETDARTVQYMLSVIGDGIVIDNCRIERYTSTGTTYFTAFFRSGASGGSSPASAGVHVSNCEFVCNRHYGVEFSYDNLFFDNCTFSGVFYVFYSTGAVYHSTFRRLRFDVYDTITGAYFIRFGSMYSCRFDDIVVQNSSVAYSPSLTYVYGAFYGCCFSGLIIRGQSGDTIYGLNHTGSNTSFTLCQFTYSRILLNDYDRLTNSSFYYDYGSAAAGGVEINGNQAIVMACKVDRYAQNGPGIYVIGGNEGLIANNIVDNTGTSPSILGNTGANDWNVQDNTNDVAPSANGGTGWTILNNKLI